MECTSQTLPFGYIHDDIAGQDALVITDEGGQICRLPKYRDKENKKESKLTIEISEDGSAKGNLIFTEYLHGYASSSYLITSKDRELNVRYLNHNLKLPKIQLNDIVCTEDKSPIPSCSLSANFNIEDFANKTGSRIFIPLCPLNKAGYDVFKANSRKQAIQITNGYSECDSIEIKIPDLYSTESLPKNITLKTPYGSFETQIIQDDNKITYIQKLDVFSGKYDSSEYQQIKSFFSEISSAVKRRMVIKKS